MKLTRKQQFYLAVLGLGLVALLLDRTVFAPAPAGGEAGSAAAVEASPATAGGVGDASEGTTADRESITTVTIADQLRRISEQRALDPASIADAFQPSETWFSDDRNGGSKTHDEIVREFKDRYRLTGVLHNRGQSVAIIQGPEDEKVLLSVNEPLELFKLVAVDERSAVFERGSIRIVLSLPGKGGEAGVTEEPGRRP